MWAALAATAAPGACALGLLMTIDAPLLCCWSLALYTIWRAIETELRALRLTGPLVAGHYLLYRSRAS
ncbi:MAG: glycosyltransferase family 39 protein [Desulfofustis sp. PB-SRB1]|nr:glycosyltransferase family 39 protein [Desulfofustis sp. PB-SRB1]